MSAHNHDEELKKAWFGRLKRKAATQADEILKKVILDTDITGLSKEDATKKLHAAIDNLFEPDINK